MASRTAMAKLVSNVYRHGGPDPADQSPVGGLRQRQDSAEQQQQPLWQAHQHLLRQQRAHLRGPHPDLPAGEVAGGAPAAWREELPHLLPGQPALSHLLLGCCRGCHNHLTKAFWQLRNASSVAFWIHKASPQTQSSNRRRQGHPDTHNKVLVHQ